MPNCLRRRRGAVLYARSQRPLRASPSLSHSADGGEGARGANFDVKLHHNNGSQHVQLRGGGGGGGGAVVVGQLQSVGCRESGGAEEQGPCLYVTQFNSSSASAPSSPPPSVPSPPHHNATTWSGHARGDRLREAGSHDFNKEELLGSHGNIHGNIIYKSLILT